jgi:putative membrane protein
MMGWDYGIWGLGWMIFGSLMMIVFWGGLIALIVLAVRGLTSSGKRDSGPQGPSRSEPTALEILKIRYARGEITREEYEEMRQTLLE